MNGNIVLIDDRAGSKDLEPYVPDSVLVRLEAGDVEWEGNGPEGPVRVGAEVKKLGDMVTSIRTGRLVGHQIPQMLKEYDYVYLILTELIRQGAENGIEVWRKGRWMEAKTGRLGWTALHGILTTLSIMWGVSFVNTTSSKETGELVRCLARWWGKPWGGHKAHKAIYTGARAKVQLAEGKVSVARKIASILPGIGVDRSAAVEEAFPTIRDMVMAGRDEWEEIPGVGKVTADRVWRAINEEEIP